MRAPRTSLLLAAALAVAAAAPAAAQTGGASDVTGPLITGSGVTGSSSTPGLSLLHPVFMDVDGRTTFTSRDVGCQVRADVESLVRRQADGRLAPLVPPGPRDYRGAEAAVWSLLLGAPPESDKTRVWHALAGERSTPEQRVKTDSLVVALIGLARDHEECPDPEAPPADARHWARAVRAYEAYLRDAPDDVMARRPGELVAIHTFLTPVMENAIRVGRRHLRGWRRF